MAPNAPRHVFQSPRIVQKRVKNTTAGSTRWTSSTEHVQKHVKHVGKSTKLTCTHVNRKGMKEITDLHLHVHTYPAEHPHRYVYDRCPYARSTTQSAHKRAQRKPEPINRTFRYEHVRSTHMFAPLPVSMTSGRPKKCGSSRPRPCMVQVALLLPIDPRTRAQRDTCEFSWGQAMDRHAWTVRTMHIGCVSMHGVRIHGSAQHQDKDKSQTE